MTPFSWRNHQDKALQKKLDRSIHLARTNPDYQIKYPSEARDNPDRLLLSEPHVEAVKRITHDHLVRIKHITTPAVERPQRLNKLE